MIFWNLFLRKRVVTMPNANLVAARNQLRTLVSIYNSNFDQYQQATYNETQVRVDFVNQFFNCWGGMF